EGQRRYAAGDYLVAADRLEAAYALDPDPAYLFNIAQAYRFGNACAKAATSYKVFLAKVPNPPNAAKVQQYLEQSEECARKQAAAERPVPPTPDPVVPPPPPPAEQHPGRTQRIDGIGVAAFGVVVLGAAGYYTWKIHDYTTERAGFCTDELAANPTCMWTQEREERENELEDLGQSAQKRARIGWAVGGAALIGGVVLYMLGRDSSEHGTTISIVPSTDGAMALGAVAF
ncbi:MAG: hypothetical protein ABI175_08305, partial [Polyangiales bacterium]